MNFIGINGTYLASESLAFSGAYGNCRFRLFKKPNIRFITESAISPLTGDLVDYSLLNELLDELISGRIARAGNGPDLFNRDDGTLIKVL